MAKTNNNGPSEEELKELKGRLKEIFEADPSQEHNDHSLRRFLRAFKGVHESFVAILKHNKWRQEYGVATISSEEAYIAQELANGEVVVCPHRDMAGRPVVYVATRKHNTCERDLDAFTRFVIFQIENACKRCYEDVIDNICIVFDLKGFGMANMDYQFIKNLIWLLSRHYPERLGVCLLVNSPAIFNGCWTVIRPWLDENTASKVTFVASEEDLCGYLHPDILPSGDV